MLELNLLELLWRLPLGDYTFTWHIPFGLGQLGEEKHTLS